MDKVRKILRLTGFSIFLIQLLLSSISIFLFLLAVNNKFEKNHFAELSLFCAVCGIICSIISVCSTFRYGKMASCHNKVNRVLSPKYTIVKTIKIAILSSLIGAVVIFLGLETISIALFSTILAPEPGILFISCEKFPNLFVKSYEILTMLACANLMAAHCVGLVGSLWGLNIIRK